MNTMIEEEAKRRFCPLLALAQGRDNCVAARCMFWRWSGYKAVPGTTGLNGEPNDEAHGYCGLAGACSNHP